MKTSTKLFIAAIILFFMPGFFSFIGFLCFVTGLILLIIQSINNHANGTSSGTSTQKKDKDTAPPWEK